LAQGCPTCLTPFEEQLSAMIELCPKKQALLAWASAHAKHNRKLPGAAKGAVRILLGLYLGNALTASDAATLVNLKVSAVCSVGPKSERVALAESDGAKLMRVPIPDNDQARILPFLPEVCAWMNAQLLGPTPGQQDRGGADVGLKDLMDQPSTGVLVHCRGGMNRSPRVIAAYLIWRHGCTVEEAIQIVREARPAARFGRGPDGVLQADLREWAQTCAKGIEKEALGEAAEANVDTTAEVVEHAEGIEKEALGETADANVDVMAEVVEHAEGMGQ